MTTIDNAFRLSSQARCDRPIGGRRFDLPVALLSLWLLLGTYLDGFAHHNIPDTIDTFFTPWHAILYSGFLAVAGFLLFHQVRNMAQGHAWNRALPAGYTLSLLGIPLFMLAGVGDALWHGIFGFETGIEALLSPTHLLLVTGAMLLFSGPLRAAWRRSYREAKTGWADLFPAVLSLLLILSALTFFTEYANTLVSPDLVVENPVVGGSGPLAALFQYHRQAQGVAGVLIPAALITGILLVGLQRWTLPPGSLTLIVSGNGLLMAGFHYSNVSAYPQVLVPILAGGLIADLAYRWLKPSATRVRELRLFAFIVPFALFALYFAVLVSAVGVWWSIHMWSGAAVLAGVVGLLMSLLALPPLRQEKVS